MKRKNPTIILYSFGEYSAWNRESKSIPKILNITTEIKAEPGTEFGYVLLYKTEKRRNVDFQN